MKNIYYYILLLALPLVTASCVKDEKDIFDLSAAERMTQRLIECQEILTSAENGWLMEYYPEKNYKIGGYAMIWKFNTNGKVDVSCETETFVPAREVVTSDYELIADQGPVLTFNSYNKVLHYYGEPSSSDINGMEGDYEFIIMDTSSADEILLKGKKYGNKVVVRRIAQGVNSDQYLREVEETADNLSPFGMFSFVLNGERIGMTAVVDRTFQVNYTEEDEDKVTTVAYAVTPEGIRLAQPFEFNGVKMQVFSWNKDDEKLTCTDPGVNAYFESYFPDDYQFKYFDLIGDYDMVYDAGSPAVNRTDPVRITQKKTNATFTLESDIFPGQVELVFHPRNGTFTLMGGQVILVDEDRGWFLKIFCHDRAAGYLNTGTTVGLNAVWNEDRENPEFTLVDNGVWITYKANGLLLRWVNSANASQGNYTGGIAQGRYGNIKLIKK